MENSKKKTARSDHFDRLPDDLVIFILCLLSSSASRPSDFICVLLTCKKFHQLGLSPRVLSQAGAKSLAIRAKNWSENAYRFLKRCIVAGNMEASYMLGMIEFYCVQRRKTGSSLMAKAAMKSHGLALYSLAVIQFNGSGGSCNDKDLTAGVVLCVRAASLGHIEAIRELGHCLLDGYGIRQNVAEGQKLLNKANASEVLPAPAPHPANRFLMEWFGSGRGLSGDGLRLCRYVYCGCREMRCHEFPRCSMCYGVNYRARRCQELDRKLRHMTECTPNQLRLHCNNVGGLVKLEEG